MRAASGPLADDDRAPGDPGGEPLISIIVPVLNEALRLPLQLDRLAALPGSREVVVVDGGSVDESRAIAGGHSLRPLVAVERGGRGAQLNAGAAAASGEVLLFLHADTELTEEGWASLRRAISDPHLGGGNFELRYDSRDAFARTLELWRRGERRLGVYYGDSAIFCRRTIFEALGGYRPLRVMEDYDFARRLERCHVTVCLPQAVITSTRRWRSLGVARTFLSWIVIRYLFLAGVPERWLAPLYRHRR